MNWVKRIFNLLGIEKGFLSIVTGNTISRIVLALFWLGLAAILTVEDYGNLNYLISIASIATLISLLGLTNVVKTYLPKGKEELQKQAFLLVLIVDAIIVIPLFILINNPYVIILFLSMSFFRMYISEVLARREHKKFFLLSIVRITIFVPLSISLFYIMGLNGIILGIALSRIFLSYGFFKSIKGMKFQFTELRKKTRFIIYSFFNEFTSDSSKHLDKLLIAPLLGFQLLGLYQIGFQFLMLLSILPLSITQFLHPQEAAGIRGGKIVKTGIALSISFAGIAYFSIPIVINNLFPNFVEGIQAAQITIISIIPITFTSILNSKFLGREHSKPPLIGNGIGLGVFIVLLVFLGSVLGLIGLSFAVLISYSVQAIILVIIYASMFKESNQQK